MVSLSQQKAQLHTPSLEAAAKVLEDGLKENFAEATCEVVQCPDLSSAPWGLAANGLCGSPRIGELGGVRYLCPFPKLEKVYDLRDLAKQTGLPDGLMIGAGAGPFPHVGKNSELIQNIRTGSSYRNESHISKTTVSDSKCIVEKLPSDEARCAILLNFFACEGEKGPVLKVRAKTRTGSDDFVGCMRKTLEKEFQSQPVGVGGTFLLKKGTAKVHVMPGFSKEPLTSEAQVDKWLKYFDVEAPMIFMSVFLSRDPGLGFRLEHTHGYGVHGGGHYHFDTTPDEVEYEGYFNIAETVYMVDKP